MTHTHTQSTLKELLISDSAGVYIPKEFATSFGYAENFVNWDKVKDSIEYLKNVDDVHTDEHYWETWIHLESIARINTKTGQIGRLYQDGDLWLIGENDDFDSEADYI
jgi:hypothetical protein